MAIRFEMQELFLRQPIENYPAQPIIEPPEPLHLSSGKLQAGNFKILGSHDLEPVVIRQGGLGSLPARTLQCSLCANEDEVHDLYRRPVQLPLVGRTTYHNFQLVYCTNYRSDSESLDRISHIIEVCPISARVFFANGLWPLNCIPGRQVT
jgi:hypothetical protein